MNIINKNIDDILKNKELKSKFISVKHKNLDIDCNILNGNFYLDSFNFFPILEDNYTFKDIFSWGDLKRYENFYKDSFYKNFLKNKDNIEIISNVFILGSSSVNNYYRNLITFLPRIFFNHNNHIKLAIHRNSSNKFRNFLLKICRRLKIKVQIVFLDNDIYFYKNSLIPQFMNKKNSIKVLNNLTKNSYKEKSNLKLYIIRNNASFRNIFNEWDVTQKLKKNGFLIVDPNELEIWKQIELFSNAKVVISAAGSGLANIVFCPPKTKVFEISPIYKHEYEKVFQSRYKNICQILNFKYYSVAADSIEVDASKTSANKIISSKVLKQSNYYKNLLLKLENIDEILNIIDT